MKDSILVILPDGVGIKNYLYTDVFKNNFENLILFHNLDHLAIVNIQAITKIEQQIVIPAYNESFKEIFLRELVCYARLKFNANLVKNNTILQNWNWTKKKFKKLILHKTIEFVAIFINNYSSILQLESAYQKSLKNNIFYKQIVEILTVQKPKSIFCTHQRGLKMATIFAAAKALNIPITTVIYSWDNLPKARLALRADKYLVWSQFMKNEMQLFYPEINLESIIVTGTPQFEFYKDKKNIIDKSLFYKKYNLDIDRKIICFSGDDELTSPDDPKYLDDIACQLKLHNLENEFQILLRRCPVDISGRYDWVIKNHKNLIKCADPLWNFDKNKNWETIYPTINDVELLVSTVFYSDLVINIGSTMAFDFAMFHKPCLYINYDQDVKKIESWSVKIIYKLQHFRSMPSTAAVIWINNKSEIAVKIRFATALKNQQPMIDWTQKILFDPNNASRNISQNI